MTASFLVSLMRHSSSPLRIFIKCERQSVTQLNKFEANYTNFCDRESVIKINDGRDGILNVEFGPQH